MSGTDKALTVKQPWAWAIVRGGKDVENRSQRTKHRGRIFIHSSAAHGPKDTRPGQADPNVRAAWINAGLPTKLMDVSESGPVREWADVPDQNLLDYGQVIGSAVVVGCHHADDCRQPPIDGKPERFCSVWAMPGYYHWELSNRKYFDDPFPAKGKLGLWNIGPDDMPPKLPGE